MTKNRILPDKRSTMWTFLIYQESAPDNYLQILEENMVPFILSPWHDKDIDNKTGEFKKAHKHGALFFDSLKSYSQVSDLISSTLNAPQHVEVVMSPTGLFDYFTHAQNPDKTPYNVEDIESGAGFNLDKFLLAQQQDFFLGKVIDTIEEENIQEFGDLVIFARQNHPHLLKLVMDKAFFFSKYMDSRRYRQKNITVINPVTENLPQTIEKEEEENDDDW